MKYTKRTGTKNHGTDFEINMTALLALKFSLNQDVSDILIASNIDGYGAFDDIVIQVKYHKRRPELYAVQLKHHLKNDFKISTRDFNKNDKKYNIEKYKNSFKEIGKKLKTEGDKLMKDVTLNEIFVCLLTNASVMNANEIFPLRQISSGLTCSLLPNLTQSSIDINNESKGFHIKINESYPDLSEVWKDIKAANITEIIKCFQEQFKAEFENEQFDPEISIKSVIDQVYKSFPEDLLIVQDLPQRLKTVFSNFEEYRTFFQHFRFYDGQVNYEAAEKQIQHLLNTSFGKNCPEITKQFIEFVKQHIQGDIYLTKEVVKMKLLELLTGIKDETLLTKKYEIFKDISDLKINEQRVKILKEIKVSLQGRPPLNLHELTNESFHENLPNSFLLSKIKDTVRVGIHKSEEYDCYIRRKFYNIFLRSEILWQTRKNIFIFSEDLPCDLKAKISILNDLKMVNLAFGDYAESDANFAFIVGENEISERINEIKANNKLKSFSIHHLKIRNNSSYLEWQQSWRGVENLNNFVVEDKTIKEEKLLEYFVKPLNVISAIPGMGKTTVLNALANYCRPDVLALKLDLNKCGAELQTQENELRQNPLEYILRNSRNDGDDIFEKEIFKYLKNENRLVLFIDSFDEISPTYWDAVLSIIKNLKNDQVKIWVFTRPIAKRFFEERLNILAITMANFTAENAKDYLTRKLKTEELKEANFFLTDKSFTFYRSVPQYLYMLVKIWNTIPDPKSLGVAKLYENFTNLCFEKCMEKNNLNKVTNGTIYKLFEDIYKSLHKTLALVVIFGKEFLIEYKIIKEDEITKVIDDFKNYNFNLELIVSLDKETPIFVHKTYAEYFAAVRIIEEKDEIRIKLYEVLFKQEFQLVRLMFDRIAAKDNPLHLAVLEEDFEKVQALCSDLSLSRDAFNRSPLHLALGYSDKTHEKTVRLKIANELAIHCKNNKLIYQLSDGLLKLNFYEHAVKSGNRMLFFDAAYLGAANILELIARLDSTCVNQQYFDGKTALHLAAVNGKDECVRCLFEMGADVSLRNEDGLAAVQIAAQAGHLSVLELFHKKGVDINLDYSIGITPLDYALRKEHQECADFLIEAGAHTNNDFTMYFAAGAGYIKILRYLIEKDVEAKYVNYKIPLINESPLHSASYCGRLECVKLLIKAGAQVNVRNGMGYTPLHCAASRGHMDILIKLKEAEANVNSLSVMNETPLHRALEYRQAQSALYLIENGADINLEDGNGMTPLHYAAENGYEDLLKLLVDKSADINVGSVTGYTPLHLALCNRNEECAKYLIEKGAQIKKTMYNNSPVHFAASSGYINILKLLSSYVDIIESESKSETTLHFASLFGQLETVKYLLESGAQVNQKCEDGRTPLHEAAKSRNPEVINFLKQKNANISEVDCRGWTPLHHTAIRGYVTNVKCLISSETINRATEDGHTPLHYAAQRGHSEVIRELLKANANTEARNFKNQKPLDLVRKDDVKCIEILKSYGPESFDVQKFQKEKSKLRELGFCLQESEENEIAKALVMNAFDDLNVENILHIAAEKGYLPVLKQLAARGVEVDCIDKFQRTALFLAARMGHSRPVSFILDQDANVNFTTFDNYTPLLIASEFGHLDVVKVLINKGAPITPRRETIRLIFISEHLDVLKYFLEENVYKSKELMSDFGHCSLSLATQIGHFKSVSYFLKKKIDVNQNFNGGTPLHHAAFFGHLSILKLLIKKGAKLDTLNFEGQTAEDIAIKRCHIDCVKYLKSKMDKIKRKLYLLESKKRRFNNLFGCSIL